MSNGVKSKPNGKAMQQLALVLSDSQLDALMNGERVTVRLGEIELTIRVDYTAPAYSLGEA